MNLKQKLVAGASVLALTLSSVPAAFASDWNDAWKNMDHQGMNKQEFKKEYKRNMHNNWTPAPQDLDQYNIFYVNKLKIKQKGDNNTVYWVFVNR